MPLLTEELIKIVTPYGFCADHLKKCNLMGINSDKRELIVEDKDWLGWRGLLDTIHSVEFVYGKVRSFRSSGDDIAITYDNLGRPWIYRSSGFTRICTYNALGLVEKYIFLLKRN